MHEFTLILSGLDVLTPAAADALYQVFDDGTAGSCNGVVSIDFHRDAPSLREAIISAIADIQKAEFRVARVETDNWKTIDEINATLAVHDGQHSPV